MMSGDSEDRAGEWSEGREAEIDAVAARLERIRHDLELARSDREQLLARARRLADMTGLDEPPAEPSPP